MYTNVRGRIEDVENAVWMENSVDGGFEAEAKEERIC